MQVNSRQVKVYGVVYRLNPRVRTSASRSIPCTDKTVYRDGGLPSIAILLGAPVTMLTQALAMALRSNVVNPRHTPYVVAEASKLMT